jgi:hypothetical protein
MLKEKRMAVARTGNLYELGWWDSGAGEKDCKVEEWVRKRLEKRVQGSKGATIGESSPVRCGTKKSRSLVGSGSSEDVNLVNVTKMWR